MGLEQVDVREIVDRAVNNKLDIPEFQREFVWDAQKVRFLGESLYREYPVGSFLFWDSAEYTETKGAQGAGSPAWIVDGQQRTTALCLLLGRKPYWWPEVQDWNKALKRFDVHANFMPDDDIVEFSLPNPIRRKDPRWFPIREVLRVDDVEELTPLATELAKSVAGQDPDRAMALFPKIHGRMQQLWQVTKRTIPVVTIDHEPEDVAEIFARLNRAGTRVREADVTLALAAVQNPGWVREDYLPFAIGVEDAGWDLDAGVFIRTITGVGVQRARLKEVPNGFWKPEGMIATGAWKRTKEAINAVLKRLAELGLQSDDLLPSNNSLTPLFVFHDRWHQHPDYSFNRLYRWFLLANRDGRYGGSATTALNEDVRALSEAPSPDAALEHLHSKIQVEAAIEPESFMLRYDRAGNRFLRLMVYLTAYDEGASDWADGTLIGYDKTGSPVTNGYKPHWHHIFPKKILGQVNTAADDVNSLANITVMNEATNVKRLAAKRPADYISEYGITDELLKGHHVPRTFPGAERVDGEWDVANYAEFLIGRSRALADKSTRYLELLDE